MFIDSEIEFLINSFKELCFPKQVIDLCLTKARKMYFNPNPNKNDQDFKKAISLPYNDNLNSFANLVNRKKLGYNVVFKYNNTIRKNLVKNNANNNKEDIGVYAIPCKDCTKCYIGESGRSLQKRKQEHIAACRKGNNEYNAVAKHTWEQNHRIAFNETQIIYRCNNKNIRRTIEGALISLNSTFENNTGLTKEDIIINHAICRKANIKDFSNISAKFRTAASPVSLPQTAATTTNTQLTAANNLPNNQSNEDSRCIPPRRSERLQNRGNRQLTSDERILNP